eukprot:1158527-Pelagomonas_calceolata.AAC.2
MSIQPTHEQYVQPISCMHLRPFEGSNIQDICSLHSHSDKGQRDIGTLHQRVARLVSPLYAWTVQCLRNVPVHPTSTTAMSLTHSRSVRPSAKMYDCKPSLCTHVCHVRWECIIPKFSEGSNMRPWHCEAQVRVQKVLSRI